MKKTKFSDEAVSIADKMVNDYASLERNLRELRTILAAICFQQDDKCLTVPFSALQLPAGVELEVSVDRHAEAFQFKLIGLNAALGEDVVNDAAIGEGAGLAANDHVASGLG